MGIASLYGVLLAAQVVRNVLDYTKIAIDLDLGVVLFCAVGHVEDGLQSPTGFWSVMMT